MLLLQSGAEKLQKDIEMAGASLRNAREKASTLGDVVGFMHTAILIIIEGRETALNGF